MPTSSVAHPAWLSGRNVRAKRLLVLEIDDTIERRRGKQIAAKGIYRDPVRSSHGYFVKASGLRWLLQARRCKAA